MFCTPCRLSFLCALNVLPLRGITSKITSIRFSTCRLSLRYSSVSSVLRLLLEWHIAICCSSMMTRRMSKQSRKKVCAAWWSAKNLASHSRRWNLAWRSTNRRAPHERSWGHGYSRRRPIKMILIALSRCSDGRNEGYIIGLVRRTFNGDWNPVDYRGRGVCCALCMPQANVFGTWFDGSDWGIQDSKPNYFEFVYIDVHAGTGRCHEDTHRTDMIPTLLSTIYGAHG